MNPILSNEQKEQFIRDGFVVVSGLIPDDVVASTRENLCDAMGISMTDANTWPDSPNAVDVEVVELTNDCRTEKFDDAAFELVGDVLLRGQCLSSSLDIQGKPPYIKGFIPVLTFPRPGEKRFDAKNPHLDFHVDGIHFTSLWPQKILLVAMVYLSDTELYGGATVVRPGSHRQVFEYWINRGELPTDENIMADLDYALPVAVSGKAGDVIFLHHLMVHSGSPNHDNHVRLGLNANLTCDPEKNYEAKIGAPQNDWTPLDKSLRTDHLSRAQTLVGASS